MKISLFLAPPWSLKTSVPLPPMPPATPKISQDLQGTQLRRSCLESFPPWSICTVSESSIEMSRQKMSGSPNDLADLTWPWPMGCHWGDDQLRPCGVGGSSDALLTWCGGVTGSLGTKGEYRDVLAACLPALSWTLCFKVAGHSWPLAIQDFGIAAFLHDAAAMKAIAESKPMPAEHSALKCSMRLRLKWFKLGVSLLFKKMVVNYSRVPNSFLCYFWASFVAFGAWHKGAELLIFDRRVLDHPGMQRQRCGWGQLSCVKFHLTPPPPPLRAGFPPGWLEYPFSSFINNLSILMTSHYSYHQASDDLKPSYICNCLSSHLVSSYLFSSCLKCLVMSHIISAHLISLHLISSHVISSNCFSSFLIISHHFSSCLIMP